MILYLIYGFGMVTCTVSPLSRFTVYLLPVYRASAVNLERGDTVQVTMPKPYIKYKTVMKVFITANMKNSKSHCKQEVDVR
jgi:hypothetical protein